MSFCLIYIKIFVKHGLFSTFIYINYGLTVSCCETSDPRLFDINIKKSKENYKLINSHQIDPFWSPLKELESIESFWYSSRWLVINVWRRSFGSNSSSSNIHKTIVRREQGCHLSFLKNLLGKKISCMYECISSFCKHFSKNLEHLSFNI